MNATPAVVVMTQEDQRVGAAALTVPQLVGQVYEAAPAADRGHMLEQLLRPLGVLALVAVADGVFAKIRFRGGWPDLHVRLEDAQNVQASDVITLVDYVQQVSVQAVDGLAQMLTMTPMMATSAAAGLLVTLLVQRARTRRANDVEPGPM
ncbi:MAG: hypothetical protein PHQ58_10780 [Rhodoferax sp.]|uniref:hypothetical protein n=1 Tax=Rhodoferax sp. TaxID=50421 RepID=UPI00263A3260|nr:hypothetical protein [Rhodoferax sp.]MDD2880916.1 hypothetical protein [Rhodoferax sp.]